MAELEVEVKNEWAVVGDKAIIFLPATPWRDYPLACWISLRDFNTARRIGGSWGAFWHSDSNTFYVRTTKLIVGDKRRHFLLHRFILRLTDPKIIPDHVDHDGLNNTRDNLSVGTHRHNDLNRFKSRPSFSGYAGVYWHPTTNLWKARVNLKYLGLFTDPQQAFVVAHAEKLRMRGEALPAELQDCLRLALQCRVKRGNKVRLCKPSDKTIKAELSPLEVIEFMAASEPIYDDAEVAD